MNALTLTVQSPPEIDPEERLVGDLPDGEAGTEATVAAMVALIREASKGPRVVKLARTLRAQSADLFAAGVFAWLRSNIRFTSDPPSLEFLRHPERVISAAIAARGTLLKPVGDCDDVADLCCSLLLAGGLRPVLVVIALRADGPFVHVYSGYRRGSAYVPLDPQELTVPGIEVEAARRRVFDVT